MRTHWKIRISQSSQQGFTITVEKKNIAQFDMEEAQLDSDVMSYVSGKSRHVRLHCNDLEFEMTCKRSGMLGSSEATFPTLRRLTEKLVRTRAGNP